MSDKPEALRLADALESADNWHWMPNIGAAAELRRLYAENFVLAAGQCVNVTSDEGGTPRCAEIARLHAECEALRKDAERYRWLRDMDMLDQPSVDMANAFRKYSGSALDVAIDAIREK